MAYVEQSSDLIGITDDQGNLVYANPATRALLGLGEGSELELTTADLFPPEAFETYFEQVRPALLRGEPWQGYLPVNREGGPPLEVWMTVVGDVGPGGEVRWLVTVARDVTEWAQTRAELSRLAAHDELTGLAGRHLFTENLRAALARADRTGQLVAVAFVDIDDLKPINDQLGHRAGDQVLIEMAARLTRAVRPYDTVARWGGDEFVVLLDNLDDEAEAAALEARIDASLNGETLQAHGHALAVSASLGMALGRAGSTSEQLLHQADAAMYEMKLDRRTGSPGAPDDRAGSHPRHEPTTHDVAVAVTQRAIVPYYQPVVDLRRGEEVGRQALARWTAPGEAPRAAAEFLDLVEGTGVSLSLDLAILRDAAHDAMTWSDALDVYVHVSSRFVMRPDAATFVEEILQRTGLHAGRLHLEIPEAAVGARPSAIGATLHALHSLGLGLVLDARGPGAAPPAAVDDHLFDELRFRLPVGPQGGPDPDVRGTVARLPSLGFRGIVAVGVESAWQEELLIDAGCDRAEGWRYGPAVPSA